ncbi:MAG: glyceraldehyde-3-phosphate dehydrogenase, partial [Geobacteraceae bacterium]|nr:glyceraldehyde-3-phosphate dehydrogenase [Geobacteraceae bacterium]
MSAGDKTSHPLGINGLGRIGKLTLWNHRHTGYFNRIIVNTGREVGRSLDDLIQVIETDSTYGPLGKFLYGYGGRCDIKVLDADKA